MVELADFFRCSRTVNDESNSPCNQDPLILNYRLENTVRKSWALHAVVPSESMEQPEQGVGWSTIPFELLACRKEDTFLRSMNSQKRSG